VRIATKPAEAYTTFKPSLQAMPRARASGEPAAAITQNRRFAPPKSDVSDFGDTKFPILGESRVRLEPALFTSEIYDLKIDEVS